MLCKSHNNLPALHTYLDKIFPWFSSLVLKEGTCLKVVKQGYHPEIAGVMSKDGETMHFEEVCHIIIFPYKERNTKISLGAVYIRAFQNFWGNGNQRFLGTTFAPGRRETLRFAKKLRFLLSPGL